MKQFTSGNAIALPYALILIVAFLRLVVNHPYNFIPIFSCLLFFGAVRPMREFAVPFLALVGVDIFLTTQRYGYALTADQALTWIWYLAAAFLGAMMLGNVISAPRVIGASLIASVSFFLASNFAVWETWDLYPKTLVGLGTCYTAAVPFFRNSVITEVVFSLLIFMLWKYRGEFLPVRRVQNACLLNSETVLGE